MLGEYREYEEDNEDEAKCEFCGLIFSSMVDAGDHELHCISIERHNNTSCSQNSSINIFSQRHFLNISSMEIDTPNNIIESNVTNIEVK